ncbi:tensin-4 isoform X1 [Pelobates cultripes]|uniref:Tensin-4 isoform X1 n=1 Tax=Pelobates cultripes TaxID=61616 RepID=A0AAD1WFJ6_PELCU|nr:tensin-4 isoform X1 [Pelobates cultripes]
MSQVIPNHVLRVGQTVSLASKDESDPFRQGVHPMCISMNNKCSYFTTERYTGQVTTQVNGHVLPNAAVYGEKNHVHGTNFRVAEKGSHRSSLPEQNRVPGGMIRNNYVAQQSTNTEVCDEGDPISPSLDISIDHLNQLILQLDPTFQPLPIKTEQFYNSSKQFSSSSQVSSSYKPEISKMSSSPEIKCVNVHSDPRRNLCQENIQRSASPTPNSEGILISRGTQRDNCTTNGNVVFNETHSHVNGYLDRHQSPSTGSYNQMSEGIAIPHQRLNHYNTNISSSMGSENISYPLYQFRNYDVSSMSNSPGSDTSYILGSTQSLHNDEIDGQQLPGRIAESPFGSLGSFSQLNSPGMMSPSSSIHYFDQNPDACSHPALSMIANQSKTFSRLSTKGHANSCPASVASSSMDIPILLVNGCPESQDRSSMSSTSFHGSQRRKSSSSFNRANKTYSDSSISTFSDSSNREGQTGMKFVMATSKQWFQPSITRDKAIEFLKDKEPGTFLIRDSTTFRGSFGLAMKVPGVQSKTGKDSSELVRHFLIESSAKGVHLKGASDEPYFGSLSALVHQHSITSLSLPCKLLIPDKDQHNGESSPDSPPGPAVSELNTSAACNVLYLNSVSTETLTGSSAIQKAVSATFEKSNLPMQTIVHFKANEQGVTLTDVQRKVFFRRHYPLSTLNFCSVDPELRKWQKHCRSSRIFGFVAKNPTDASDNVCHIFAEYDAIQPVSPLITFLTNLIQQQEKV